MLFRRASLVAVVAAFAACKSERAPTSAAPPSVSMVPAVPVGASAAIVADAKKRLADPDPKVRVAAAAAIRGAIAADAAASGDPGEASWKAKLALLPMGITEKELSARTGGTSEGGAGSGQSHTTIFRLDDYWVVELYFDNPDSLREIGPLSRRARDVWVEPPKNFSGTWLTFFVNGVVSQDIEYASGRYLRFTAYYDNGQRAYEQRYVDSKIDGLEIGYHRDGSKSYELHHAAGKTVGRELHWFPNGKLQSEQTYVDGVLDGTSTTWRENGTRTVRFDYRAGKETGQAAWDETGKLLYAHGTADDAK